MAVITGSVYCPECCNAETGCFGHVDVVDGGSGDPEGPCSSFRTSTSTPAPSSGYYYCVGGIDDEGTISWPNGSFFSDAIYYQCYGAHVFDFTSYFAEGDTVTIEAGSADGNVGSYIECCKIEAP